MLEINATLFVQIANFLILLFLLNLILYRPIRRVLSQRGQEMGSLEEAAEGFKGKALQHEKALQEGLMELRKEGFKEKEGLKGAGLQEEKGVLHEAASLAEGRLGKARDEIQNRMVEVRQSLQSQVEGLSKELAEKILGRSI